MGDDATWDLLEGALVKSLEALDLAYQINPGEGAFYGPKLEFGAGIRVEADTRNEKIGYKIREHTLARVPFLLVAGARERDTGAVALRSQDGKDLGVLPLEQAVEQLSHEVQAPDYAARFEQLQRLRQSLTG